jgi:hypothetical protein
MEQTVDLETRSDRACIIIAGKTLLFQCKVGFDNISVEIDRLLFLARTVPQSHTTIIEMPLPMIIVPPSRTSSVTTITNPASNCLPALTQAACS